VALPDNNERAYKVAADEPTWLFPYRAAKYITDAPTVNPAPS
jgi:hypothetical protein